MEKASGEFIMIFPHDSYLIYNDFFNECENLINLELINLYYWKYNQRRY